MSCCWDCCCGNRGNRDFGTNVSVRDNQIQAQAQAQALNQDQELENRQRSVFKEIGNVNISIENDNVIVLVLVLLGLLDGTLDSTSVRPLLEGLIAKKNANV
jgi:hypothetical protein